MDVFKTFIASQKALNYVLMFLLLPGRETSMFIDFSLLLLLSNEVKLVFKVYPSATEIWDFHGSLPAATRGGRFPN